MCCLCVSGEQRAEWARGVVYEPGMQPCSTAVALGSQTGSQKPQAVASSESKRSTEGKYSPSKRYRTLPK